MFHTPIGMAVLWRWTGLEPFAAKRTRVGGKTTGDYCRSSALMAVHSAAVYAVYAYIFAVFASEKLQKTYKLYVEGTDSTLHLQLFRDTSSTMLFVTSTTVYWCVAAYRREHARAYEKLAAVERQLFGTAGQQRTHPYNNSRTVDTFCWALYALLAVTLLLDDNVYTEPWMTVAVHVWGHYVLITGNVQFAVIVSALRSCYCELNSRMPAYGRPGMSRRDVLLAFGGSDDTSRPVADDYPKTSTVSSNNTRPLQNIFGDVILDKEKLLTMLKYFSDLHWSITQIVRRINDLFKFRLFVFFLCGLLHLMFTPYVLSLTILFEDTRILYHMIERILWFVINLYLVFLMIYPCALLSEEAAKMQILLGGYLNTKIDYVDIKKVETYAQQLDANKPEFRIYSMFVIDKPLIITLIGAIATYLVIILQLPGQS